MADQTPVTGQFIPLARQNELARTPSSYAITPRTGEDNNYQGESFYDVLNRTQLTSAQLKSMQAPQNNLSSTKPVSTGATIQTPTAPAFSSEPTFTPAPGAPYNQQLLQETKEHLKNIPVVIPQDDAADNAILSNMEEYAAQKAATQAAQENTQQPAIPAVKTEPSPETSNFTDHATSIPQADSSAIHAALTRNAVDSQPLESKPVTSDKPETVPFAITNEPVLDPAEEPVSTNGFPAYIPTQKIAMQADNAKTQSVGSTPAEESQTKSKAAQKQQTRKTSQENVKTKESEKSEESQSNKTVDSSDKKGFPQAIGNFFGSIASAVTLGFYRPTGDPTPTGFARVIDPIKKVVWDAPKSIVVDAPTGIYNDITRYNETKQSESQTIAMTPQGKAPRTIRDFGSNRTSVRKNYYS